MRATSLTILCWLSFGGVGLAACDQPTPILLPAGAASADVEGEVARGDRDCYSFGGRKGLTLSVTQPGNSDPNIAIQLYRSPWHIEHDDDDGVEVTGTPLKGAEDGADATHWRGELPASGVYLMMVGAIRGGDAYRLHIDVR